MDRMTDTSENITLPQTSFAGGKNELIMESKEPLFSMLLVES